MFIIFWVFLMDEQIFLSPKLKWSMIISNKLVCTSCLTSCWTVLAFTSKKQKLNFSRSAIFHRKTFWWLRKFPTHLQWNEAWSLAVNRYTRVNLRAAVWFGPLQVKIGNWTFPNFTWKLKFTSNVLWMKLLPEFPAAAINSAHSSLWSLAKDFYII